MKKSVFLGVVLGGCLLASLPVHALTTSEMRAKEEKADRYLHVGAKILYCKHPGFPPEIEELAAFLSEWRYPGKANNPYGEKTTYAELQALRLLAVWLEIEGQLPSKKDCPFISDDAQRAITEQELDRIIDALRYQ